MAKKLERRPLKKIVKAKLRKQALKKGRRVTFKKQSNSSK